MEEKKRSSVFESSLKDSETASKPLRSEEAVTSSVDEETKKRIYDLESELYSNIATLQSIAGNFEEGRVDPPTFKRLLKSLMKAAFKAKRELENLGLDVKEFIKREGFLEEFNLAIKKLEWEPGADTSIYEILLESPSRIAAKTYETVTSFDTLSDLIKLRYNATCEFTSNLLNDLLIALRNYPGFGPRHWICEEIAECQNRLKNLKPSDLLDEKTLVEFDNKIQIWRNEFYKMIKEASF